MEDIEYLDEYKDIVMPGINKNETRTSAAVAASGSVSHRRRRISSDSTNSSSLDADIFQKLFHGKFSDDDDELPSKSSSKGKGRRPPLSPSSSDESNDALEALFNRKAIPINQSHKRRDRYESLDSIDDLSEALMRSTPRDGARSKQSFSKNRSSSAGSNNKSNVTVKSGSSLSTKSSTSGQPKSKRPLDKLNSRPTNGNASSKNKAVTIIKPIKSDLIAIKQEPKTDPLNLRDLLDGSDSDSSYEYESDFYGDEEEDEISNAIIDLSTDTSRTNSVAETVTPVVSEDDDDSAPDAAEQQEQDQPTTTDAQPPQLLSKCGDNELLQYYLNNLSKAETPPSYKKLTNARKGRSSEKKSPSSSFEQVKHAKDDESVANIDATGPLEDKETVWTAPSSSEKNSENLYNINDSLTLESVERISLDLAEQILQIDNERTIEYERHSGSKGHSSVRSRSNVSDDHPSTSNPKSSTIANHHVRKLTYSNEQLDKCVPSKAIELRRTKSESAFLKRNAKGKFEKKRQKRAVTTDQNYSVEETTDSVPIVAEAKRKRGRPRKVMPPEIETKSIEKELEMPKEDKEISDKDSPPIEMPTSETFATVNQTTIPLATSEPHPQTESGNVEPFVDVNNEENAVIEKNINDQDSQLSDKEYSTDVHGTSENQQPHKVIEDAKLLPEDVSRDLKVTDKEAHETVLEISAYRRALRSDDRKTAINPHEEQTTSLKVHENRNSRRTPKEDPLTLVDDQMPTERTRKKNDSSTAQTPSNLEREKSPIEKQPRNTQKRSNRQKGDRKEMAESPRSPFRERITRSSKKESLLTESIPPADSSQERGERTRSSDRLPKREKNATLPETAIGSRKEIEEKSTERLSTDQEINDHPDSKTECEISHETEESVKPDEVIHDKSTDEANMEPETEPTQSTDVQDKENISRSSPLNSDLQQKKNDLEINQFEQNTKEKLQEHETNALINNEEIIEPIPSELVPEKSSTELATDPESTEKTIKLNDNEIEPKNDKNCSKDVVTISEPQPIDEQIKTINDKTNIISTTAKAQKTTKNLRKKSKLKRKKTASAEKSVEKELKQKDLEEMCSKELDIKSVPIETITKEVDPEVFPVQENTDQIEKELELIHSSAESKQEVLSEITLETNQHEQISKKEKGDVQNEMLSHQPESHTENNSNDNNNKEVETKTDVEIVLANENTNDRKHDIESSKITTEPEVAEPINAAHETVDDTKEKVIPESEPLEQTVPEVANPVDHVDRAVDISAKAEEIIEKCNEDLIVSAVPVKPVPDTTTSSNNTTNKAKGLTPPTKTPRTTKIKRAPKRRVVFGCKRKKKIKTNMVDTVEPFKPTIPIPETVQVTQPFASPEIAVYKSSASTSSTTVSPTSGSCRKLRVLLKRTPSSAECLKKERKSLIVGKMSNRFAEKLDCIAESPAQTNASEQNEKEDKLQTKTQKQSSECTDTEASNRKQHLQTKDQEQPVECTDTQAPNHNQQLQTKDQEQPVECTDTQAPNHNQQLQTKDQEQPVECTDTEPPNLNQQSPKESSSALADNNQSPRDLAQPSSDGSSTRDSEITPSETTGVILDEESSQLDEAAKRKKEEQYKADLELSIKKSGRRRKQVIVQQEQPAKKRSKIDFPAKTAEKGRFISISNKKTTKSGFKETKKIATSAVSTKKPVIETLLRPDVSLQKTDDPTLLADGNKSLNSQKVAADEPFGNKDTSYITVFTKKSTTVKDQPTQESKTTGVGASLREVNISVTVLPGKETKVESPNVSVVSASQEDIHIDATASVDKRRKFISKKTGAASKISGKKLVAPLVKSKKSDLRKSEAKTGTEELPFRNQTIVSDEEMLPQLEPEMDNKASSATKKSFHQEERGRKLDSRKSDGAKARKVADSRFNISLRKSLPLARLSLRSTNKSDIAETTITVSEAGVKESTESQNQSKGLQNRQSEGTIISTVTKKSNNDSAKKMMETVTVTSSRDTSKERLLTEGDGKVGKVLGKTSVSPFMTRSSSSNRSRDTSKERLLTEGDGKVGKVLGKTSVSPFMTRSSSSNRSPASTPVALQSQRKATTRTAALHPEAAKLEAREIPIAPRLSTRLSRKDAPMVELVYHGNRKRRLPGLTAEEANPKRVKQQLQKQDGKVHSQEMPTESATEETLQTEPQLMEPQMEESQSKELEQLESIQKMDIESVEMQQTEDQRGEIEEHVQQKDDIQMRDQSPHQDHSIATNVAFPVMITAAAIQPAPTFVSIAPVPNLSQTPVKEIIPYNRHCRVRVNRTVVRKWVTEHQQTLDQEKDNSVNICDGKQKEATPAPITDMQDLPIPAEVNEQVKQSEQSLPLKEQPQPSPVQISVEEEVKNEEEEASTVVPATPTELNFSQHIATPSVPTPQPVRFNAPTTPSASIQNNSASSAAGQPQFGSTKMFSFLYPMRYQQSYGAVGLDFCCPNLDGPMRAIDPTRLHDKVEVPVLELPQYMVISTKFISKQDKNIPSKVRAKMAEMAKDGKPFVGQSIQMAINTPDPSLSVSTDQPVPSTASSVPGPSLLTSAQNPVANPDVHTIDILSRQLPRGTTLTKKILPTGTSLPPPTGGQTAPQLVPPGLIQLPPICPADKQRMELQTRVQLFDFVLQDLSRRATMMTIAERQRTIEEIVKTSTLLPIDVDVGTKLLENYVHYLNRATNSKPQMPSYHLNQVVNPTTSISSATKAQQSASNSVLAKTTPTSLPGVRKPQLSNCLPASIPLFDGDQNIIGYQLPATGALTKNMSIASRSPAIAACLAQDQRLLTNPTDTKAAASPGNTMALTKDCAKSIPSKPVWVPGQGEPTIHSIKPVGSGTMVPFNPTPTQKATNYNLRGITTSGAIGQISDPISGKVIITPDTISIPAAPNINSTNVFVVNQSSSQSDECILPDVTNTVPVETEIKGEIEDALEIIP